MQRRLRRHAGALASIVGGTLFLLSGLTAIVHHEPTNAPIGGSIMLLAGLACYSAIERKLVRSANTSLRLGAEIAALGLILFLWLAQANLKVLIATDPVPEFVIPVWALLAYGVDFLRRPKPVG
jgi:hypothetical protein